MSTSAERGLFRALLPWLGAAAFCGVLAAVYDSFSHGVHSPFLDLLFVWPLAGAAAELLFRALRRIPSAAARGALFCSLFTGAVGSLLRGIVAIAGTASPWIAAFFAVSALWAAAFLVFLARSPARQ